MQQALLNLKAQHPDKRVMLIAEKGTMGVGSSRMSGVNNVALWTGIKASPFVPFINIAPVICWNKWGFSYFSNYSWCYWRNWHRFKKLG